MAATIDTKGYVKVATVSELKQVGRKLGPAGGYPVLRLMVGDQVRAVDNRCPHMGYPIGITSCA